jgi:hypothetical protein
VTPEKIPVETHLGSPIMVEPRWGTPLGKHTSETRFKEQPLRDTLGQDPLGETAWGKGLGEPPRGKKHGGHHLDDPLWGHRLGDKLWGNNLRGTNLWDKLGRTHPVGSSPGEPAVDTTRRIIHGGHTPGDHKTGTPMGTSP